MVSITYRSQSGDTHTVDVAYGRTLMEGAKANDIPGILADCGGAGACATCHVYIDERWADKTGIPNEDEIDMLDCVIDRQPNSRLSCQVMINFEQDGMIVTTPKAQL